MAVEITPLIYQVHYVMTSPPKTIYMIAPVPAINVRTRLVKQVSVLEKTGFSVTFLGWERQAGEAAKAAFQSIHVQENIILRGGGYASRLTHIYYIAWMIRVFFKALALPTGAKVVCLGFETAFPIAIVGRFKRLSILFDDADRFSMILSLSKPLNRILQALEKWTSHNVAIHIIPGWSRYEWKAPTMKLLRNSPNQADFETAKTLVKDQAEGRPFTLYANGWIGETRGAPIFLELMQRLQGDNFLLKLIGRGEGEAYTKLCALSNVDAHGGVPQTEALAAYLEVDLVLTYYDPRVPINRMAESNKWGDCVYLGVPFVVNSEVETAADLVTSGAAFAVPYANVQALEELVRSLAANPDILSRYRENISSQRDRYAPFDSTFKDILYSEQAAFIE